MLFRRPDATAAAVLVGTVVVLDLLWSLLVGSTGHLAYGFLDEPAHLATCAVVLLALAASVAGPLPRRFLVAAFVASVAIDVDHVPGLLGWDGLSGALPRPYSHSLVLVLGLVSFAALTRRRDAREVALGVALGISAHLLRDLATGPGVPLAWPLSDDVVSVPYALFALGLAAAAVVVALPRRAAPIARFGLAATLAALAIGASGASAPRALAAPSHDAIGVYIPGSDWEPSLIDEYARSVGSQPAIVSIYRDWSSPPFETQVLTAISTRGSIPMVTWEPWRNWSAGVSLQGIASGAEDAYVAAAASDAAAWGGPIFLRFGHEMNGGWYPWGVEARAAPATYRAAWRRVVAIFRERGADNVRWVWTPYIEGERQRPFRRYYPGDEWVDWAGLDGFNWGAKFLSFGKLFQRSYATLVKMTKKPLIVAETGSIEYGGSKPAWIQHALSHALPRLEHIRALVWWSGVHKDKGTDLRLDTSPASFAAWSQALRTPRLLEGPDFLLARPGWLSQPQKPQKHRRHRKHRKTRR